MTLWNPFIEVFRHQKSCYYELRAKPQQRFCVLCNKCCKHPHIHSEVTFHHSVTHIKSDITIPNSCGHHEFVMMSSSCGKSIHPQSPIFLSLGGLWHNGVSVLWTSVMPLPLVIVLFGSHMEALHDKTTEKTVLLETHSPPSLFWGLRCIGSIKRGWSCPLNNRSIIAQRKLVTIIVTIFALFSKHGMNLFLSLTHLINICHFLWRRSGLLHSRFVLLPLMRFCF